MSLPHLGQIQTSYFIHGISQLSVSMYRLQFFTFLRHPQEHLTKLFNQLSRLLPSNVSNSPNAQSSGTGLLCAEFSLFIVLYLLCLRGLRHASPLSSVVSWRCGICRTRSMLLPLWGVAAHYRWPLCHVYGGETVDTGSCTD